MTLEHEEVVFSYREKLQAANPFAELISVHIDYNPECDPAELEHELDHLSERERLFHTIDPVTRLEAKVVRLQGMLTKIGKLAQTNVSEFNSQSEDVTMLKYKLFNLTEFSSSEHIEDTIEYARQKGVIK